MAGTSREISSVMTSTANNYNTRLDSLKMLAGLIAPRIRLGFVSPTPRLRLGFDLLRALSLVAQ